MKEVKQYLIIREDLNMSTGKIAAQVAHASSKIFFDKMKKEIRTPGLGASTYLYSFEASEEEMLWVEGQFTKIVKKVKNENQLLKTYNEAKQSGLNVSLILDAGLTELEGENYTAIAIGPNYIEDCEPIVKKLPIKCYLHDVVIPTLRIKNVCVLAVKLRCEVLQSRDGQFISFTGKHKDVSWVLHALSHTDNTPNGLLSLIKLFSN